MSSTAGRPFAPDHATPPGETLAEWLDEQAMTHAEFAARAGMSAAEVGRIIHGTAVLVPGTATRLEQATGIPARIWHALEAYHRDHLARLEPPSAG